METFTDVFGEPVTGDEETGWTRGGIVLGPCPQEQAVSVFNSMAPEGWTPPVTAPVVPASCTNFQARAMFLSMPGSAAGRTLFDDVNDMLKSQGGAAFQAWEFANDFTRDGALVQQTAAALGMTSAQLDAFFVQAAQVSA